MKYENDSAIYKWTADLQDDDHALIATFYLHGQILAYGFQDRKFVCWTTVRRSTVDEGLTEKTKVVRVLVPTGGSPPVDARYIETLQVPRLALVYHLFAPFDLS